MLFLQEHGLWLYLFQDPYTEIRWKLVGKTNHSVINKYMRLSIPKSNLKILCSQILNLTILEVTIGFLLQGLRAWRLVTWKQHKTQLFMTSLQEGEPSFKHGTLFTFSACSNSSTRPLSWCAQKPLCNLLRKLFLMSRHKPLLETRRKDKRLGTHTVGDGWNACIASMGGVVKISRALNSTMRMKEVVFSSDINP